eukprot:TRINITY_DN8909_c0_g1_i2.p1 TRINITY_DN8909_c0_g1~~TRINITY_DN8909_c0_g1_i2.p1  ORF type:complete len:464 (+),score=83.66 TRINITY_DN8909_c0_g1_i2:237-1628(+)
MFENWIKADPKTHNHWKMFIQVMIMSSNPFIHDNIITFFCSYFPKFEDFRNNKGNKSWITCLNFLIDFLLTIPVLFLVFTFYERGIYLVFPISLLFIYVLPFFNKPSNITKFGTNPQRSTVMLAPGKFKFVFMDYQISTVFSLISFAILYCDTTMFDNNLSKTTKGGIGSMDLGAGLIIFTSGITSRQARDEKSSLKKRFSQSLIMTFLCLNIGIIRSIMAELMRKGDSSHGSHWNIFLMLATIMFVSVFIPNIVIPYCYILAFAIALVYQIFLKAGLTNYIIPWSQHKDFFGRNAVGLCQTIGLFSCYLMGLGLGRRFYTIACQDRKDEDTVILVTVLKHMFAWFAIFLLSYFIFEPTGPTACNLPYVAYILAMGHFTILAVFIPERIIPKLSTNLIYDGPAKSSRLIYFVTANLFTGITNILFDLEKHSVLLQTIILISYMLILHALFAALVKFKVKTRFW